MSDLEEADAQTVVARLIRAADDELAEFGSLMGRFDAVAHRAGVSRATAYRQLGSVSALLIQVGLRRSEKHIARVRELMACESGALAKIEVALVYGARELPNEPIVLDLITRHSAAAIDPDVRRMVNDVLAPALAAGQKCGEVRTDVGVDYMIEYLTDQTYLVTQAPDRSEAAVRRRFRCFIAPALAPTVSITATKRDSGVESA